MRSVLILFMFSLLLFSGSHAQDDTVKALQDAAFSKQVKGEKEASTNPKKEEQNAPSKSLTVYKNYPTSAENLYYSTISGLYYNGLKILELQSKSGFIYFMHGTRAFMAHIVVRGKDSADLKITPADGNYQLSQWIINKIFQSVDSLSKSTFLVI